MEGGWSREVSEVCHMVTMHGAVPCAVMHAPVVVRMFMLLCPPQARVAELQSNKQPASDSGAPF